MTNAEILPFKLSTVRRTELQSRLFDLDEVIEPLQREAEEIRRLLGFYAIEGVQDER